jgi:hypothetical protein
MQEQDDFCVACRQPIENALTPYRMIYLAFVHDQIAVTMTADMVVNILEKYIDKNGIHLSATQLILFRPDEVLKAIKEVSGTEYSYYELQESCLCSRCAEAYTELYPLK